MIVNSFEKLKIIRGCTGDHVDEDVDFYDQIVDIYVLRYLCQNIVYLFKCN